MIGRDSSRGLVTRTLQESDDNDDDNNDDNDGDDNDGDDDDDDVH
jgi:hypothetical protein